MGLRKRGVLELYRVTPAAIPAAMDELILAAARAVNNRPNLRTKLLAFAVAATMVAVIVGRWMSPGELASRAPPTRDFGSSEGKERLFLTTLDLDSLNLQADAGPGSQEGLP